MGVGARWTTSGIIPAFSTWNDTESFLSDLGIRLFLAISYGVLGGIVLARNFQNELIGFWYWFWMFFSGSILVILILFIYLGVSS